MQIFNLEDIEEGHFVVTVGDNGKGEFRCHEITKIYQVGVYEVYTKSIDLIGDLTDIFEYPGDEVYTTLEEIVEKYPEEMI